MQPRHRARRGSPNADDVLDAARQLLQAEGPGGLTVRRLATDLGVSRQVVYSRFGSKAGLLTALYIDGFHRLTAMVRSVSGPAGTESHVLDVTRAYRARALEAPAIYRLMFDDRGLNFVPDDTAREVATHAFDEIVAVAAAWRGDPRDRGTEARALAASLWAGAHGVVSLERAGHLSPRMAARQLDEVVLRILHGSRPSAEATQE